MMLLNAALDMSANLENSEVARGQEKSFHSNLKDNGKECSNYQIIAFTSHASKVMFKILQPRLQQYTNQKLADVPGGFRKGRGNRDQVANICWIVKKAREFEKNIYFCLLTMPKPLTVLITIHCGKF